MPPRGNEGLDFTPILTHYLFLFTTILAIVGWVVAFVGQIAANVQFDHNAVGVLWFAIFLQLFLILGVLHTLASDSIAMNRFQISTFGAIAIVFAVTGTNNGVFSGSASLDAMGAGWLILAVVDVLWVLYFTSEEDSLTLHVFNALGTGGLTPPSRRRRTRNPSVHGMAASANGYASPYNSGGPIGGGAYDPKGNLGIGSGGKGPGSFSAEGGAGAAQSIGSTHRPMSGVSLPGIVAPVMAASDSNAGQHSPLMGGNAGVGAGGGVGAGVGAGGNGSAGGAPGLTASPDPAADTSGASDQFMYTAKALYAYTASPDDPNEISFAKGEIMDILDNQGKWWQARKADGRVGIAPSNYLQII